MREIAQVITLIGLAAAALAGATAQATDAPGVLSAARDALGGEKRLSAVKSFVATGRTRQVRGENLVPIEFEISVELPDKYLRKDEIPAQESGPTSIGFNGGSLIQLPVPALPPARAGAPAPSQLDALRAARAVGVKQDFARLALGMFASSFSAYPMSVSYLGEAEAPQGKADVLAFQLPGPDRGGSPVAGPAAGRGPGGSPANLTLRFFVYKETHLPIMVSWETFVQGKPVEQRLYYQDYRDVDGVKFPYRLRRASGPDTTEETAFDRFRVNPRIDPKKFEVR